LNKLSIGKGAAFLYIENVVTMAFTYVFWYFLSKITTPEVIGISSSIIALGTIFTFAASVGIPVGSQRYLGRLFQEQKLEDAKVIVKSSLLIVTIGILACTGLILATKSWLFHLYELNLIVLIIGLTSASVISLLFRNIIISSLETKKLLLVSIISSGIKLVLAIILVLSGTGELGIIIGFTIAPFLSSILFAFSIMSSFKETKNNQSLKFIQSLKMLLNASVVNWIPSLIDTIGAQIGTIILLSIQGAIQAGVYYVAFQITMGILTVTWAIYGVIFPALSAMDEGRRQFLVRTIKIGLIIILPLSSALVFNPEEIMEIFGPNYDEGSFPLQILLISLFPTTVTIAILSIFYAYGKYKEVLIIGFATSIPRVFLYVIFVTWFSSMGAAISYTIGSLVGFIVSVFLAKRIVLKIFWKDLMLIFLIPMITAFLLSNLKLQFVIYFLISISCSYILLLKCKTITRNDVQDCLSLLPPSIANPIINTVNKVGSKLNKSY
jgi:O-antigen/teichoic acid export membrane protein